MTIQINFEIGDKVWFIHPKNIKVNNAILKGVKTQTNEEGCKIKYHVDMPPIGGTEEVYVWEVFKTKDDLLKSL